MTDIDLDALSPAQLKQLENNLTNAIAAFPDRRKAQARAAAEAVAKEYGLSGRSCGSRLGRKSRRRGPKYRHPEDPEITRNGHGGKPTWIAESLEARKSLEDFAI